MYFQYVPYIWPLATSALVTLALAIYAFRSRDVRGALPFALCMLLSSLWAASSALERSAIDLPTMLFWANVPYLSYTICPVLWLIMVLIFIERDRWITPRNIALLLILPAITQVLLWMGDPGSLIRQDVFLDTPGDFPAIGKTFGPWFWLILAYADLINLVSMALMGWTLLRKSLLYRRQVLVLFIGLGLVILQNIAYVTGTFPARYIDLTPVIIGISGLIIAWGIFSYQLFDIVPVARENIIEDMADGLIVLDSSNRIADINPTAKDIFGKTSIKPIGQDAGTFFNTYPELAAAGCDFDNMPGEMVMEKDGRRHIYEVASSPLFDRRKKRTGQYLTFHDVTGQREAQAELLEQQRALASSKERERMARDLHDNLGQVFGFINVQAQAIRREMSDANINTGMGKLERLIEVTQSAHRQMREYIHSTREETSIGNIEFASALKHETERVKKQSGLDVLLDIPTDLSVNSIAQAVLPHILSIIREALTNTQKHAGAKNASVVIRTEGGRLCAIISDDGKGFSPDRLEKTPLQGLGLNNMKERALEIGGQIHIISAPGKGTQITLTVPLNAA